VTYSFGKADRLASLTDCVPRTVSYTYFPDGHLQSTTNANGTTTTNSEVNAQRLTQVWNKKGTGTTIGQHTYTLDNGGNRTQRTETLSQPRGGVTSGTATYRYDALSHPTAETTGGLTGMYGYDICSTGVCCMSSARARFHDLKPLNAQMTMTNDVARRRRHAQGHVPVRGIIR